MYKKIFLSIMVVFFLAGVSHAKTINIAADCTWPPMEMMDTKKQCIGFTPELLHAIARAGGFEVNIINVAWDGIFAGLGGGKYDMIASSVSITEQRKKRMDFSDPYFEVKQGVVVKKDSAIKTYADLAGKNVGAQIGTTGFFAAKKIKDGKVKSYNTVGLAMADLAAGRVDAVLADDAVATDFALNSHEYKDSMRLAFLLKSDTPEYLGFAFPKGSKENLELVNKGLAAVKASGEYDKIFAKWFVTQE